LLYITSQRNFCKSVKINSTQTVKSKFVPGFGIPAAQAPGRGYKQNIVYEIEIEAKSYPGLGNRFYIRYFLIGNDVVETDNVR